MYINKNDSLVVINRKTRYSTRNTVFAYTFLMISSHFEMQPRTIIVPTRSFASRVCYVQGKYIIATVVVGRDEL